MGSVQNSLVTNHQFLVSLNLQLFSFAKVTNITGKLELETVAEGGYNDSPRFFQKPKTSMDTLVLEKGIQTSGTEKTLKLGSPINAGMVMVTHNGSIAKTYAFEYGMVTKWETDALDAMGSGVLIRRVEISHTGLMEV